MAAINKEKLEGFESSHTCIAITGLKSNGGVEYPLDASKAGTFNFANGTLVYYNEAGGARVTPYSENAMNSLEAAGLKQNDSVSTSLLQSGLSRDVGPDADPVFAKMVADKSAAISDMTKAAYGQMMERTEAIENSFVRREEQLGVVVPGASGFPTNQIESIPDIKDLIKKALDKNIPPNDPAFSPPAKTEVPSKGPRI